MAIRADLKQCDVFISWTGVDENLKNQIEQKLIQAGIIPLVSSEDCQGDFVEWSKAAATSAHIFMPIITKSSLNSVGMAWELEEIDKKLCGDHSEYWKKAIVPVCENLQVYEEYLNKLSAHSKSLISNLSVIVIGENGVISERILNEIAVKCGERICDNFYELYTNKVNKNYIKLIPLNTNLNNVKDKNYHAEDLYIYRKITLRDENLKAVKSVENPEELTYSGTISFIYGPAGSGKTQYVNQIETCAKDKLVITLECCAVSESKEDILTLLYQEFHSVCGKRSFFSLDNFNRLLQVRDLVLVLDGLDEITTKSATRDFMKKISAFYDNYRESTAIILTGRNEKDSELFAFNDAEVKKYSLDKLTDSEIEKLGSNLFILFGAEEKGKEFFIRVKDLNEEIRANPLLLSQLALVYQNEGNIPQTVVGILDAVSEITFRQDSEGHTGIALPKVYEDMIKRDLSDILKAFSRERYISDSLGLSISFEGIFNSILKDKYGEENSACAKRCEFLLEYLQNRAIYANGKFYHKMFLEYFTALSFFEDGIDEHYGKMVDNRPIAQLFSNYSNAYWEEVIKLFVIKVDNVIKKEYMRAFYGELFACANILDFTLLLNVSNELVVNGEELKQCVLRQILTITCKGECPAYGPLFYYVPAFNLFNELLCVAEEYEGNAVALSLVRDVCFIYGKIYTLKDSSYCVSGVKLFKSVEKTLKGVRKALNELFYLGESSYKGGEDIYPRCFNVSESREFIKNGHGLFARMGTPFKDELNLYKHKQLNEFGGEYVGFVSMPYNVKEMEEILNLKPTFKLTGLALTPTKNKTFEYVSFTRSSVKMLYVPENIENNDLEAFLNFAKSASEIIITNNYILYLPKDVEKLTVPNKIQLPLKKFSLLRLFNKRIKNKPLKRIDDYIFSGQELKEVVLPNTIKELGAGAFQNCYSLTSINLPKKINKIDENCFFCCKSLLSITIPKKVKKISKCAFWYCESLRSVYVPNGVEKIEERAFDECESLRELVIPQSVKSLHFSAFGSRAYWRKDFVDLSLYYQGTLKDWLNINKNDKKLEQLLKVDTSSKSEFEKYMIALTKTFAETANYRGELYIDNQPVMNVVLPKDIKEIRDFAFSFCPKLQNITIPYGVTSIGWGAFGGCESLSSIEIPNSVTSIGGAAFANCTSFTSVSLPNSIKTISDNLFYGCNSLSSICLPNGITSIGKDSFGFCESLASIDIPNSVTTIGAHAFEGCESLASIDIPNSVMEIGNGVFSSCSRLKKVKFSDNISHIYADVFTECDSLEEIYFPKNLKIIYDYYDFELPHLKKIFIPEKFAYYDWVFSLCKEIIGIESGLPLKYKQPDKLLVVEDGVTVINAGEYRGSAFTKAYLPNSVKEIKRYAFGDCEFLTEINLPASLNKIEYGVFENCSSLESIILPKTITAIDGFAFYGCYLLKSITMQSGITSIGDYAFVFCSFTSVKIPETVTFIGKESFSYCRSLQSIEIPNSVTKIGDRAFSSCESLKSATISNGVTSIATNLFSSCDSLASVKMPNEVKEIGDWAFRFCHALQSIEIPHSVTYIGSSAFDGCSSLTEVVIPKSVRDIRTGAFKECSGLKRVVISANFKDRIKDIFGDIDENIIEFV